MRTDQWPGNEKVDIQIAGTCRGVLMLVKVCATGQTKHYTVGEGRRAGGAEQWHHEMGWHRARIWTAGRGENKFVVPALWKRAGRRN